MQPTFQETILSIKTISNEQFQNCICSITYQIVCNYKGESQINMFDVDLQAPSIESFIAYQNLNQDQVLTWVQDAIGTDALEKRRSAMVTMIDQIIAAREDKPRTASLPWQASKHYNQLKEH